MTFEEAQRYYFEHFRSRDDGPGEPVTTWSVPSRGGYLLRDIARHTLAVVAHDGTITLAADLPPLPPLAVRDAKRENWQHVLDARIESTRRQIAAERKLHRA